MKKTIVSLALVIISITAIGQTKDSTANKPIPPPELSDSTEFISVKDINDWLKTIEDKVSFKTYKDFMDLMSVLVDTERKKWQEKEAKKQK